MSQIEISISVSGLQWVMPLSIKDAYVSWCFCRVDRIIKKIWQMIPTTIFWCFWKERNCRCFDGISTLSFLKASCLVSLFSWNFHAHVNSVDSYLDCLAPLNLVQ